MIAAIGRLLERHIVVFVAFHDAELETLAGAAPQSEMAVGRAVIAKNLLDGRHAVLERLRRQGVQVIETTPEKLDDQLVEVYLDLKRRQLVRG